MTNANGDHRPVSWRRTFYTVDNYCCVQPTYEEGNGYFQKWIDEDQTIAHIEDDYRRIYEIWNRNLEFLVNAK